MKLIFATFALFMLVACGGGGGGNAPSTISESPPTTFAPDPTITPEQQRELNSDLQDLRTAANGDAELLAEIARLQREINARDRRIEELRAEIAELENRIPPSLPQPTTKECNGVQIPIADNCPPPSPQTKECNGAQIPIADNCPPPSPQTKECNGAQIPIADNCPPTTKDCPGGQTIPIADTCPIPMQTCTDGSVIPADENCPVVVLPECTDFRERDADGECTYDTAEFRARILDYEGVDLIGALYAYEQGYHGQGVTVVNAEQVFASHEDLHENVLTMNIGLDCSNHWQAFTPGERQDNAKKEVMMYGCDHLAVNLSAALVSVWGFSLTSTEYYLGYHGTGSGGIIAAARNGKGSHGVAPRAKLIPIRDTSAFRATDDTSDLQWIIDNDIPIVSYSTFYPNRYSFSVFVDHYRMFADTDTVHVFAGGNTGRAWRLTDKRQTTVPHYEPDLEDNWLVAAAVDRVSRTNTSLTIRTIPCGEIMRWCITAVGSWGDTPGGFDHDDSYWSGFPASSAATPQVAGALAVLKSAMPKMKMTEIRTILLNTATPLYADASKNGVRMMDENNMPILSSVYGWGLVNISAGITHLQGIKNQMSAIESMGIPRLGGAAAAANGGKFAAAAGESAFRFWGGLETESVYGGLATAEYGGISAFGEVGNSSLEINSFLANGEVQNAESESWTAGIQRGNIWRHNDNLQISARQESRLNDGELVLQYSFGKQIRIPIKQKPATIWTAAYSQESDDGKWTAAMEWNALTEAKGFSFAAEIDL